MLCAVTPDGQISDKAVSAKASFSSRRNLARVAHGQGDRWTLIREKICSFIGLRVPVGYEDETGFHFGTQPE